MLVQLGEGHVLADFKGTGASGILQGLFAGGRAGLFLYDGPILQ